ncbi:MAG: hypothetical protein ABL893_20240 [Hyphomicrobium sp.]|nr:hypothetical protein [Hyphomicrobium sp.]
MKTKSNTMSPQDVTLAKTSPTAIFDSPAEVLARHELSREQKIEILKSWELDARALQRATDESMGGGEPPELDAVNKALLTLDPKDKTRDQFGKAPTKI